MQIEERLEIDWIKTSGKPSGSNLFGQMTVGLFNVKE
jgi:hypothetical protein